MLTDEKKPQSLVAGLDLGGTKLASALFEKTGGGELRFLHALENRKYDAIFKSSSRERLTSGKKSKLIEEAMVEAIEELSKGQGRRPEVVGICSAGFVENGYVVEAWNTGMKNYPLRERIARRTGIRTYLYKDSTAPIFALQPDRPSIVFGIGTGFAGVSCEPDLSRPLRSYTAHKRLVWIPCFYCNDDPGYIVTFSTKLCMRIMKRAIERAAKKHPEVSRVGIDDSAIKKWAGRLKDKAKKEKKLTPKKLKLMIAALLAPEAAKKIRPEEICADIVAAASVPRLINYWLTGELPDPPALDALAAEGDPHAAVAFYIQAEFIGFILFRMQEERREFNLHTAEKIYATGSGYNAVTHKILSEPIISAMREYCEEKSLGVPTPDAVELIDTGDVPTSFACIGAATGAAMGIE